MGSELDSFLKALNGWQKGGDQTAKQVRGGRLKEQAAALKDPMLQTCRASVYRRLALNQSNILTFITTGQLTETISAWTLDPDIAKGFKGGVPEEFRDGKKWFGVILKYFPKPEEVILNLEHFFADLRFHAELKSRTTTEFKDGIGRYMNSQREVVLEVQKVSLKEIWVWAGMSSTKEVLAESVFQQSPTTEEMSWFDGLIEKDGVTIGKRWTSPGGARNVTRRVLDRARELGFPVPDDPSFLP